LVFSSFFVFFFGTYFVVYGLCKYMRRPLANILVFFFFFTRVTFFWLYFLADIVETLYTLILHLSHYFFSTYPI
jgi:hypothetical protein